MQNLITVLFTICLSFNAFGSKFNEFVLDENYDNRSELEQYFKEQDDLFQKQLDADIERDKNEIFADIEISIQESIDAINKENIKVLKESLKDNL